MNASGWNAVRLPDGRRARRGHRPITLRRTSPRKATGLSAPFILINSISAMAAVPSAGQPIASGIETYGPAALAGAMVGTAIGLRWMSQAATRYVLAIILAFAGMRLLLAIGIGA